MFALERPRLQNSPESPESKASTKWNSMLFLTSFAGLLSLGAAAPSISTFPCGFESSTQVGYASFLEWIVQIPEQVLPQFKWCNKRSESGVPPIYDVPSLPKRSKTSTESGTSIDEPDSRFNDPAPIPKRSETSIESGESVDEPEPQFTNLGVLPKRSEGSTEEGESAESVDKSDPHLIDSDYLLPKRSETSTESDESVDEPEPQFTNLGILPKRSEATGESVDEPGRLPWREII